MTTEDILQLRDRGEMSKVQFKNDERTHDFLITIARKGNLDTIQANPDTDLGTIRANPDTDLDTSPQRRKLTNKEKDIIQFCSVPRSAKEILNRVGVSSHTKNREKYVTSLVEAGYLEMTNPDNPNNNGDNDRKNTDFVAGFGERQRGMYHLDHQHRQVWTSHLCICQRFAGQ